MRSQKKVGPYESQKKTLVHVSLANSRPWRYQHHALPTELMDHHMSVTLTTISDILS